MGAALFIFRPGDMSCERLPLSVSSVIFITCPIAR
jgi:hypothetical protein